MAPVIRLGDTGPKKSAIIMCIECLDINGCKGGKEVVGACWVQYLHSLITSTILSLTFDK